MGTILSLLIGIGLSAACGFRVFVPLLVVNLAAHSGHLKLAGGFEWVGSNAALVAFAVATILEIAAYYVPWVDNLVDTIATPAAVIAGTLLTASLVADMSPFLKWTLAAIVGGGVAGTIQATTVVTRAVATTGSGGLINPLLATVELGGSLMMSLLAVIVPVLAAVGVVGILAAGGIGFCRKPVGIRTSAQPPASSAHR